MPTRKVEPNHGFSARVSELWPMRYRSQHEFAVDVGTTDAVMSSYCQAGVVPHADRLVVIAERLGTTVDYLLCGVEPPLPRVVREVVRLMLAAPAVQDTVLEVTRTMRDYPGMIEAFMAMAQGRRRVQTEADAMAKDVQDDPLPLDGD